MTLFSLDNNRPMRPSQYFRTTVTLALAMVCASCTTPDIPRHANSGTKADSPSTTSVNQNRSPTAVPGGMVIHIDPKTGALLQEPAPGSVAMEISPAMRNAMSTSGEGLVVRKSTLPGGGEILDLQGRFQSPLIATIDTDGKVKMHHPAETGDYPHMPRNSQVEGANHDH